jgi:hypothetical protein
MWMLYSAGGGGGEDKGCGNIPEVCTCEVCTSIHRTEQILQVLYITRVSIVVHVKGIVQSSEMDPVEIRLIG